MGLALKGERPAEIVGFARAMRERAVPLPRPVGDVFDTCGTGGDGAHTFNVSTAAAIVLAGAGVRVAKHGNRAVSSRAGSADVFEALGVSLDAPAEAVLAALERANLAFFFAPMWHPSMRHAGPTRRELGLRTAFNLLGPLTNPAGARAPTRGRLPAGTHRTCGARPRRAWRRARVGGAWRRRPRRDFDAGAHEGLGAAIAARSTRSTCTRQTRGCRWRSAPHWPVDPLRRTPRRSNGSWTGETGPRRDVVVLNAGGRAADCRPRRGPAGGRGAGGGEPGRRPGTRRARRAAGGVPTVTGRPAGRGRGRGSAIGRRARPRARCGGRVRGQRGAQPGRARSPPRWPARAVRIIAECKRRSPSRGVLCRDYRPADIAAGYDAARARPRFPC